MADINYNNIPNIDTDWQGYSGQSVQRFIKDQLQSKVGVFYYDAANNRYLVFASEDTRDRYIQDTTLTDLILGTFDAPFNYSAEITLVSEAYNAVFLGSTGNYIQFNFDIKNKQGASTGENVIVTYTITRNAVKQVVTETHKFGDTVRFNVDKYLGEGTNTIIVGVVGQTSLAATTSVIVYQVVNLALTDNLDISKVYNLADGPQMVEIPFTVSGYGTKRVEWYIDGEQLPFVMADDEVVDVTASRTKYIEISNLQQGTHTLQMRAYTVVNGEQFYTDTLYRELIVYTKANTSDAIISVATTIPRAYGVLGINDNVAIYDMVQYVPYTLRFATYSPTNAANTEVVITLDGKEMGRVGSVNNVENEFILTSTTSGTKALKLATATTSRELQVNIKETDMDIHEITNGLVLDFSASAKSNNSPNRDSWTDGVHSATLTGFNWNATSGWVNGRLEMNAGAKISFDYAPLAGNATNTGKTIEIEWSTKNVTNDNAVICDLRGDNGVGILITATKVSMTSADGVVVETEYKSDENVRIGFVINQSSGTTNRRMSFIFANGVVSRSEQWSQADNYVSDKMLEFTATAEAQVSLKAIRIYDTALTLDNMLNNFTLYRDSIAEMLEVYDRNDVYEEGTTTFSPEKMMGRLPVMIVTGDIPTLENTSDKDTQIVVDIEYHNLQEPSRSFTMKNAAMRPQGTSSMGYPKKNFRIYTQKLEDTIVYDASGNPIEDKLYSFKEGAQPVDCWCLKADYAESSGTHNTGIARLWNKALYDARVSIDLGKNNPHNVDNQPLLRTGAQSAAIAAGYKYDVRTTIDGFPILLFYRPSANDDIIFIGKYNFNNDKSTESVFGFTGIPGFDNSRMQCWEVLNNGNPLALFTTADGFDEGWSEAFESRYPDTKTPNTADLKAFCQWMTNVSQSNFTTEKWEHLNVYMMAAYWVYLMRHAAADQFVKNAMFTSEDGQHFYYILYDNDTINGLINTGRLRIQPTDDRQTVDETGSYVFAGHDSRLWNMLENDEEFISIVSAVDNALYSAGISYANTIRIFDNEQADKWVERVYNQDAQYKYIGPYAEKGIDNLFMLQGKRDLHRRWWLAKRFSIYDAKYVSGPYKSQAIEIKCLNGTVAGQQFSIVAGYPLDYGYGINNVPRTFGIPLKVGDRYTFETRETVNLGDPVRIYAAPHLAEVDFSAMSDRLAVVTVANVYNEDLGTKLTKLVLGSADKINAEVTEISGLKQAIVLEHLDVQGMTKINSLDLSNHQYFKTLKAIGSGISSVSFAKGAPMERLELPSSMRVLSLTQLPYLAADNVILEDVSNLQSLTISSCPNLSNDFGFVYNWYDNKATDNSKCTLAIDGIVWENVDYEQFLNLCKIKTEGGSFSIKGYINIPNATIDAIYTIRDIFGETAFYPNAELYIEVPTVLEIVSDRDTILEGENLQLLHQIYPVHEGTFTYSIVDGREGCSIDANTGLLTTTETAIDTSTVMVRLKFKSTDGKIDTFVDKPIEVERRTYPSGVTINGDGNLLENLNFTWSYANEGVNGDYSVEWSIDGTIASYYEIASADAEGCQLRKVSSLPDTAQGTLNIAIKRNFDNTIVATDSITVSHVVVWPKDATIVGNVNPLESPYTYTWETTTEGVNGDYYAEWSLSGDVTSVVEIASYDKDSCTMRMLDAVTEIVDGLLTLILKKSADNSVIITATKELQAMLEGVIMTSKGNPIIQAALYSNGLVANEAYTFKEEAAVITDSQLYTALSSINKATDRDSITQFDEFQYFLAVTKIANGLFAAMTGLESIILPPSVTSIGERSFRSTSIAYLILPNGIVTIGNSAFQYCSKLQYIELPPSLQSIGSQSFDGSGLKSIFIPDAVARLEEYAFANCTNLETVILGKGLEYIGQRAFYYCSKVTKISCLGVQAPTTHKSAFGYEYDPSSYIGRDTYNVGVNKLYLPIRAVGYENSWWSVLQDSNICGFTIYGKITIDSNNISAKFAITYTSVNGDTKMLNAGIETLYLNDIQYNTNVTIRVVSGGVPEDGVEKTFVYNDNNNSHYFTFAVLEPTWITIDQNITDPATMITGDINGISIVEIRKNSHRYLGKYTASGQMTICQLDDSDSTKFKDGSTAELTGAQGDVFVKLPHFWYSLQEIEQDVWKVGFFYGNNAPLEGVWNEWSGTDLLGAYEGYISNSKLYSRSGITISTATTSKQSLTTVNSAAIKRGNGFSCLPMKWYNILNLLFYATYGNTSIYTVFIPISGNYTTGASNNLGMIDGGTGCNFFGVEELVASYLGNFIGNVLVDYDSASKTHIWKITEDDGSIREIIGTMESGYVQKMVFGSNADIIPAKGNGTSSQGFCINFTRAASSNRVVYVSLGTKITASAPSNNSVSIGRLAFQGAIVEESDPVAFKSLTAIE